MGEASTHSPSGARLLVVLGTGTGVGKTWVSVGLARALRELGAHVLALKPIETGVPSGGSPDKPTDAALLAAASSRPPAEAPYQFPDGVSPHLAARRAARPISLETTLRYVQSQVSACAAFREAWVIVETAGGLLSPLSEATTNWELARSLGPSIWLLVAPDALGVLHDVNATLEVMKGRGRLPDHLVLSAARPPDASTGSNAAELASLGIAQPSACFAAGDAAAFAAFARALLV